MKTIGCFLLAVLFCAACQHELKFPGSITVPTVTTSDVTTGSADSAHAGGKVLSDGGATVLSRGVCYAIHSDSPTIADNRTINGNGPGVFESELSGLVAGTQYGLRAYATNAAGTAYGQLVRFTTKTNVGAGAMVITTPPGSVTASSATTGGTISSDGGDSIIGRGVCYGTVSHPTVNNDKVAAGTGIGNFTCDLSRLSAGTLYFIRAYAINSAGTFYGDELNFSTEKGSIATVITTPVFTVTSVSGISGGNIIADNGSPILAKGICYSTTFGPTIADSKVTGGLGPGFFQCGMSGLKPATTYHVRAFATNSAGTAYGNEVSFITKL